jgi:hypothetical protein
LIVFALPIGVTLPVNFGSSPLIQDLLESASEKAGRGI